jgi:hypothetical protein
MSSLASSHAWIAVPVASSTEFSQQPLQLQPGVGGTKNEMTAWDRSHLWGNCSSILVLT